MDSVNRSFTIVSLLKLSSSSEDLLLHLNSEATIFLSHFIGGKQHFNYSTASNSPDVKHVQDGTRSCLYPWSLYPMKIVYDRESGQSRGFGFVTFTNPRAALKAINGLDGGMLGGRTIRVNEVKKNSGKNLNRENSFRDKDRDRRESRDRDRSGRGRFSPRNRRLSPRRSHRGRSSPISPGPGRSIRARSPATSPVAGRTVRRSRSPRANKSRSPSFNSSSAGRARDLSSHSRTSQSPQSSERVPRAEEKVKKAKTAKEKRTDVVKVREELDRAVQSRQELEDKVSSLTTAVDQAKETVFALQTKSQKVEESLATAQAATAQRQQQLKKLQKGIIQVKDSSDRLKSHEKELKILMLSTLSDLEVVDMDIDVRTSTIANGANLEVEQKVEDVS